MFESSDRAVDVFVCSTWAGDVVKMGPAESKGLHFPYGEYSKGRRLLELP